jgi:hypothetical protein
MALVDSIFMGIFYALLAALFAAAAAYIVASYRNSRIEVTTTFEDAPVEAFPNSGDLNFTARWLRTAHVGTPWLAPVGVIAGLAFGGIALGVLLLISLGTLSTGTWLPTRIRCPKCTKWLVMNAGETPPFADRLKGLSAWGSVIKRIATERRFRCMYCGQRFMT